MTSRKQSTSKPYFKRRAKQQAGYVREYAYDKEGQPVMEEGFYVVQNADGTLDYDKTKQVYRDRPNRALVRRVASLQRRDNK